MSKSKGNVVDPNEVVDVYGADVLRTYVLFMGDYALDCPWNDNAIKGVSRFLDKVYNLKDKLNDKEGYTKELEVIINKTIKKVSEDYESMKYNTGISELMKLVNSYMDINSITKDDYMILIKLLHPVAPHITEELNEILGNTKLVENSSWPKYDDSKVVDDVIVIAVQVNGKVRDTIKVRTDENKEVVENEAMSANNVKKHLEGKEIVKVIVVPNKIVNIVVK